MTKKGISETTAILAGANRVFKSGITPKDLKERYSDPTLYNEDEAATNLKLAAIQLSNLPVLVEQMCANNGTPDEYSRIVLYAYVMIDANSSKLSVEKAYQELGIKQLEEKYCGETYGDA